MLSQDSILQQLRGYLQETRQCPHCQQSLSLCHTPPIHVGDGLGWGSEYMFVCLNDECSLYANGWKFIEKQYGRHGSYRYMELPSGGESYTMMVAGKDAFTGSVVSLEDLERQDTRYRKEKEALAQLETCVAEENLQPVLTLLLDESADLRGRKRAADLLTQLNTLDCVEPLRNHTFHNEELRHSVNTSIAALLQAQFLRECPFCAELVKKRATLCKHCHKELT
ncbi:MAG: zinc ribbon domain-containing protein [Desulfobulbus propionicus]|nr:MAG: zinc ribbon domain-containing protein [Desulfobulbus propionicus]